MSIGAARDGSPCAVEVFDCRSCDARHAQVRSSVVQCIIMCSAHAGKIEITRKKKRVDSCGMLVQKFEPDVRLGGLAPARPIIILVDSRTNLGLIHINLLAI